MPFLNLPDLDVLIDYVSVVVAAYNHGYVEEREQLITDFLQEPSFDSHMESQMRNDEDGRFFKALVSYYGRREHIMRRKWTQEDTIMGLLYEGKDELFTNILREDIKFLRISICAKTQVCIRPSKEPLTLRVNMEEKKNMLT